MKTRDIKTLSQNVILFSYLLHIILMKTRDKKLILLHLSELDILMKTRDKK